MLPALAVPAEVAPLQEAKQSLLAARRIDEALDRVVLKARTRGRIVDVIGLNAASATLVERFGKHDKPDAAPSLAGH